MERRVEQIAQIAAIALLVIGCLLVLQPFVTALLVAGIVCFSTWPVYKKIEQMLRGRRNLAALAMTLLLILVAVLPLALLALTLADSVAPAANWMRNTFAHGLPMPPDWVQNIPILGDGIDAGWRELATSKSKLTEAINKFMEPAQQGLLKAGLLLGEGVIQLSFAAFIGYFFYRDGAAIVKAARALTSRIAGHLTPEIFRVVGGTIQSVVYGLVGTAIAQGVVAVIGFLIAGVPGALLLGFLTFVLSMVPVGPPLVWGPAAVWLAYQGSTGWAIFMVVYGILCISMVDNVLKPILISRGSSLPFALIFLGVFGGVVAFGFLGLFLGPTLLAVGFGLANYWTRKVQASGADGKSQR
jgi:predicted PurR-regulated permease PerM